MSNDVSGLNILGRCLPGFYSSVYLPTYLKSCYNMFVVRTRFGFFSFYVLLLTLVYLRIFKIFLKFFNLMSEIFVVLFWLLLLLFNIQNL